MAIIFSWSVMTFRYDDGSHIMMLGTSAHASTLVLNIADIVVSLVVFATLALRRRFPQTAAAVMVVAATFSLCFLRGHTIRRVLRTDIALFGVPVRQGAFPPLGKHSRSGGIGDVRYPLQRFVRRLSDAGRLGNEPAAIPRGLRDTRQLSSRNRRVHIPCAGDMRSGHRSRTLGAGQRHKCHGARGPTPGVGSGIKTQVRAANHERERIGAQIRGEVSETLAVVIDKADAGIAMLDRDAAAGVATSSEAIVEAFRSIGEQGRESLAHMRSLLRVLRETGGSDDNPAVSQPLLHPITGMKSKED
ncbi:hypothetical protein OZX74_03320 [Bifidobacterium sp. ESL0798]|uniref:hypothetical protein n=1 Tax=Bifidobacterium sp. ESL0798 TaxID=2983235 RepID=UPI0023F7B2C7|nr:hypothetical protein [Bifidobacterium sp. ESL0798]WEV74567.1 hypothetical protein OZX74_03320 [Bifidobacterium sp. ESL0798]